MPEVTKFSINLKNKLLTKVVGGKLHKVQACFRQQHCGFLQPHRDLWRILKQHFMGQALNIFTAKQNSFQWYNTHLCNSFSL